MSTLSRSIARDKNLASYDVNITQSFEIPEKAPVGRGVVGDQTLEMARSLASHRSMIQADRLSWDRLGETQISRDMGGQQIIPSEFIDLMKYPMLTYYIPTNEARRSRAR